MLLASFSEHVEWIVSVQTPSLAAILSSVSLVLWLISVDRAGSRKEGKCWTRTGRNIYLYLLQSHAETRSS